MNRIATKCRRYLFRSVKALMGVLILGWIAEGPRRPALCRPDLPIIDRSLTAYVHRVGNQITLENNFDGAIGMVRFVRIISASDQRLLCTQVHEYRHLYVVINNQPLSPGETDRWRRRVAAYFAEPMITLGESDDDSMLWFGYPADPLVLLVRNILIPFAPCLAALAVPGSILICIVQLIRLIEKYRQIDKRLIALRKRICPDCGYDIRGLPMCRCPECGATWLQHEVPEGLGEV